MSTHLRGRMYVSGRNRKAGNVYTYEVIDTARNVVIHRDNSCDFDRCINSARENVALCRKAWTMGVLKKWTWCSDRNSRDDAASEGSES